MKLTSRTLEHLHLDPVYTLLSAREILVLLELFKTLDVRNEMALDDIQFYCFIHSVTDLSKSQIYKLFDMLDVDRSGLLDFDEFYLLICILLAIRDRQVKQFIYRHSKTVFELMDEDGSNSVSAEEFETFGFLFNFQGRAVRQIFKEFDVSGDQALDYQEFKMFAMACIDKQNELKQQQESNCSCSIL